MSALMRPKGVTDITPLAFEMADSAARSTIENLCDGKTFLDRHFWFDVNCVGISNRDDVEKALWYLHARGDALPYRVICHPNFPFLRRFEARR